MSCSTDFNSEFLASRLTSSRKRGSILMEFVLVLPIYILLFGALYLFGDVGLNAIRISTGDRDAAMDAGDSWGNSTIQFKSRQMGEEALKTSFKTHTYRADASFNGAWSWQAAGRSYFSYKLQSYGGGLISYPYLRYGSVTSGGNVFGTLVGGVSVLFHSKDYSLSTNNVRSYNYYTLKRTNLARQPGAYRNWNSWDENGIQDTSKNHLVETAGGFEQYWYSCVYDESYADSNPSKLDASSQGADSLPERPDGREEYKRFDGFLGWCQ